MNIPARVQIVVEHVRQTVAHLLGGQARAMMVTASRKEAVRWAKEGYIRQRGYLLVAFSGEVNDPNTGPEASTEMKPCANNPRKIRTFRRNARQLYKVGTGGGDVRLTDVLQLSRLSEKRC